MLYNIIVVFAIHWHESGMGVHPEPPSHLPSHPIPQGSILFSIVAAPAYVLNNSVQGSLFQHFLFVEFLMMTISLRSLFITPYIYPWMKYG